MAEEGAAKMQPYTVVFYEMANGRVPVREFLDSQSVKAKAKLVRAIEMLRIYGPLLREPYSKSLEEGIFELRAQTGSDATRILYFFCKGSTIVLTNGFTKKTKRTPRRRMETAKQYRADYLTRLGCDHEDL